MCCASLCGLTCARLYACRRPGVAAVWFALSSAVHCKLWRSLGTLTHTCNSTAGVLVSLCESVCL